MAPPDEPMTVVEFEAVGSMYPMHTGVGSDAVHPRIVDQMPQGANEVLVALLNATEKFESWVGVINMLNADIKETGGYRLLGFLARVIGGGHE